MFPKVYFVFGLPVISLHFITLFHNQSHKRLVRIFYKFFPRISHHQTKQEILWQKIQTQKCLVLEEDLSQARLYRDCQGHIWGDCEKNTRLLHLNSCIASATEIQVWLDLKSEMFNEKVFLKPSVSLDPMRDYSTLVLNNSLSHLDNIWIVIILHLNEDIFHVI